MSYKSVYILFTVTCWRQFWHFWKFIDTKLKALHDNTHITVFLLFVCKQIRRINSGFIRDLLIIHLADDYVADFLLPFSSSHGTKRDLTLRKSTRKSKTRSLFFLRIYLSRLFMRQHIFGLLKQ